MEEIHKIADREIRIASFDKRVRKNCADCRPKGKGGAGGGAGADREAESIVFRLGCNMNPEAAAVSFREMGSRI